MTRWEILHNYGTAVFVDEFNIMLKRETTDVNEHTEKTFSYVAILQMFLKPEKN